MSERKPPLGVKPAWMAAWSRIGELVDAIERQYESGNGSAELVEKWANEITWQCSIIEAFREQNAKDEFREDGWESGNCGNEPGEPGEDGKRENGTNEPPENGKRDGKADGKRFTVGDVYMTLVNYGQRDRRFKLGETIRYSPSEVRKILAGEV